MRGTRWLLVAAIMAILAGVGVTYRLQKRILERQAPPKPAKLPAQLKSSAVDWGWSQTEGGRLKANLRARNVRQVKDSGITELEGVELQIFSKKGDSYDLIKSAHAEFTQSERRLYAEGDVEIIRDIPVEGEPKEKKPVSIRTSGVLYDYTSGKATTSRPATFQFENGEGKAVGASYDPEAKLLHMASQVELNWKAPGPHAKPMKLESGELTYHESESKILLAPSARMTRENTVIESAGAVVSLQNGHIRVVDANQGHGTDRYPKRQLDYAADRLLVNFSEEGKVEKVAAEPNARLVSTAEGSQTTMTANRVDLDFAEANGDSVLTRALAHGNAVAESKPLPVSGQLMPETRVLRSATIDVKMRAGGHEIESVEVPEPGTLEFLPNRAAQRHRVLTGQHMWIGYGAQNRIQSFRTVEAATETDPTAEERARKRAPSKTSSKNLTAQFDPKTGQMTRMEQWDNFVYQEGDRNARAARAVMEQQQNLITLETGAKMWDATGSTFADRIHLDQRSGNFDAAGHVTSSRLPDKKKPSSELLSGDEPLQAVAESMRSANRNQLVHYQGKVVLWQGASRVRAEQVDIDREKRRMTADGGVVTQFMDEAKTDETGQAATDKAKRSATPVFTTVKAANLVYTEADRLAHYKGAVTLDRPGLAVKAEELRSFLAESGAENRMERAYADGKVIILQKRTPACARTGTGEHAEYYTDDQKIILRGGEPQLVDACRGITSRGTELTYFADDDRLLVNGVPDRPAASRVRSKKK